MKYITAHPQQASEYKAKYVDLKSAFKSVPDPRRQNANCYYPLWAMLMATVAAVLSGQTSVLATAEWLANQSPTTKQALGFAAGHTPVQSTFQRLFRRLGWVELELALSHLFSQTEPTIAARGTQALCLDGKVLRGKLKFEDEGLRTRVPMHLLSLFSPADGIVVAQRLIEAGMNEISTAPKLLKQVDWQGRVLTGDAAFCQRGLCCQVVEAGGDYLLAVKGNQAGLLEEALTLFDPTLLPAGLAFDQRQAGMVDKGHGRIEVWQAKGSGELAEISDWPYLAQMLQVKRTYWCKAVKHSQTSYYVTSLPKEVVDVAKLLQLKRGHWGIENKLHWVKDVVLGEDACLVHKDNGPQVLAALRNTALNLLRQRGHHKIKATLRRNASHPALVLDLLGLVAH